MIQKKDLQIISNLRANSRQTLTDMSKKTRIPISTIYDRLKVNEGNLIKRHTCLLDFNKIGFTTRAKVLIKVDRTVREDVKEYLMKHRNINSLVKINNNYDFLFEAVFKQIKELEEFLEQLEEKFKIRSKQVYYIIEDVKRESFLSEPEMLDVLGF
ncbi:hypothetical protein A3K72_02540 [Candidatus Woesearchaeota archaeon RBG_13_36_6]|nr:MAG: hypothetical protein A3K72_02540 [Candidatus Woesearchaeota archaeon RBG_13_36_6]